MAFDGSSSNSVPLPISVISILGFLPTGIFFGGAMPLTAIQVLFYSIKKRRLEQKDKKTIDDLDDDVGGNLNFWAPLFSFFFVRHEDPARDDMVYFVRKQDSSSSGADPYFVRRRNNPQSFPSDTDSSINWKETLFLNLLVNHCIYTIVVMVVAQKKGEWQTISKISQVVNALPSASRMDAKAEETSLVYPLMYFSIDNFDSLFNEFVVGPEQSLIIKLTASPIRAGIHADEGDSEEEQDKGQQVQESDKDQDTQAELLQQFSQTWPYFPADLPDSSFPPSPATAAETLGGPTPAPLFQGMVAHKALEGAFFKAKNRRGAHGSSGGSLFGGGSGLNSGKGAKPQPEFLVLRGPKGRGKAQVAIAVSGPEGQGSQAAGESKGGGWFRSVWDKLSGGGVEKEEEGKNETGMLRAAGSEVDQAGGVKLNALLTYIHLHWSDLVDKLFDVDRL